MKSIRHPTALNIGSGVPDSIQRARVDIEPSSAVRKSNWKRYGVVLTLSLGMAVLGKAIVGPWVVGSWLKSKIHSHCDSCRIEIGQTQISFFPIGLGAENINFSGGHRESTAVDVHIQNLFVPISLVPALSRRLRVRRIFIMKPTVKVTEGDLETPASKKYQKNADTPPSNWLNLEVEGLQVQEGSFSYLREHGGRKGIISVSGITAAIGPWGITKRLMSKKTEGTANGLLEGSGKFELFVAADVFAQSPNIDVKLQISGLELGRMDHFFKPNDGVKLEGFLQEGDSEVLVRGKRAKAKVYARFEGFKVKIEKFEERSALSAFFQSLMASAKLGVQNSDGKKYDRRGSVDIERKHKETIISFILRGMKEAAMQVASKGGR